MSRCIHCTTEIGTGLHDPAACRDVLSRMLAPIREAGLDDLIALLFRTKAHLARRDPPAAPLTVGELTRWLYRSGISSAAPCGFAVGKHTIPLVGFAEEVEGGAGSTFVVYPDGFETGR